MAKTKLLTVDGEANLNVPLHGEGDDRRFFEVVSSWWAKMPDVAKKTLVTFWREDDGRRCQFPWGPIGGLLESWPGKADTSPASFRNNRETEQFYIAFCSYYFAKSPSEMVVVLLAHEFAHLYQLATGTLYSFDRLTREQAIAFFEKALGDTYENAMKYTSPETLEEAIMDAAHKNLPVELDAARIVKDWGFDLELLDKWEKEVASQIPPAPRRA